MRKDEAFWSRDVQDRQLAHDGRSRFGAYLMRHKAKFADGMGGVTARPEEFAAAAFSVACAPIMSPPYVGTHPRVLDATVWWDSERRFALMIEFAVPLAKDIAAKLPVNFVECGPDPHSGRFLPPDDFGYPTVAARVELSLPLPADLLPQPEYEDGDVPVTVIAKRAIRAICTYVNSQLTHLVVSLGAPGGRDQDWFWASGDG